MLAVEDAAAGDVLWGLGDHQQTVRDVVEYGAATQTTMLREHRKYDSFGNVTDEQEYDAQGNPLAGTGAVDYLFAYTGRPLDTDTGIPGGIPGTHTDIGRLGKIQ